MRLAYVTSRFPFGRGESFLIEEVRALSSHLQLFIVPMRLQTPSAWHPVSDSVAIVAQPLFSLEIALSALRELVSHPINTLKLALRIAAADCRPKILARNLAVLPKGLWLATKVRALGIQHIHAHWSSTTSTLAWIAAVLTQRPWSFTAHRYDIDEANALRMKLRSVQFARAVTDRGLKQLFVIEPRANLHLIKMGVAVPDAITELHEDQCLRVLVPANLVEVKGHKYLFKALQELKRSGMVVSCELAGDGPEKRPLMQLSRDLGLENTISFLGSVSHEAVIDRYMNGLIDVVVLPSIIMKSGEQEGVPVALMEAMAFGIPVISTYSGAIPELVEGMGILVQPADSVALRAALQELSDPVLRRELGLRGRQRVARDYNVVINARSLSELVLSGRRADEGREE